MTPAEICLAVSLAITLGLLAWLSWRDHRSGQRIDRLQRAIREQAVRGAAKSRRLAASLADRAREAGL